MPFLSASGVSPYNKIRVGSGGGVELPFAFGNALEFDGVNDYLSLESGGAILSTAFEWTISLWIKPQLLRLANRHRVWRRRGFEVLALHHLHQDTCRDP